MSSDGMMLLVHSLNTSLLLWNLEPALSGNQADLLDRTCSSLRGSQTISSGTYASIEVAGTGSLTSPAAASSRKST
jgi:hypothetical protein